MSDNLETRKPMTVAEANRLVPLSKNAFYRAIEDGDIKHTRVGGRIFVLREPFLRQFGYID